MAELFTNNATSTLAASLGGTSGDTSITVQTGDGAKFPNPGAGDFFRVTLFKKATGEIEICKCTARSGDVLTVSRGEEGTAIISFNAGDIIELRPTAGFFSSLSVTSTNIQQDAFNYAADTGVANDYQVSLSPAPTAYTNGLPVRFLAANSNTGASTLQIDALGKKAIKIDGADLPAGTIKAGRVYEVIYNGTEWDFQTSIDISGKMDKVPSATAGNVAVFDGAGQTIDSSNSINDLLFYGDNLPWYLTNYNGQTVSGGSTITINGDVTLEFHLKRRVKVIESNGNVVTGEVLVATFDSVSNTTSVLVGADSSLFSVSGTTSSIYLGSIENEIAQRGKLITFNQINVTPSGGIAGGVASSFDPEFDDASSLSLVASVDLPQAQTGSAIRLIHIDVSMYPYGSEASSDAVHYYFAMTYRSNLNIVEWATICGAGTRHVRLKTVFHKPPSDGLVDFYAGRSTGLDGISVRGFVIYLLEFS